MKWKSKAGKERYQYLKSRHICVKCGRKKAEEGRSECRGCLNKAIVNATEYYFRNTKRINEMRRKREADARRKRTENGRCTRCGANLLNAEYKQCDKCREKDRLRKRNKSGGEEFEEEKKEIR